MRRLAAMDGCAATPNTPFLYFFSVLSTPFHSLYSFLALKFLRPLPKRPYLRKDKKKIIPLIDLDRSGTGMRRRLICVRLVLWNGSDEDAIDVCVGLRLFPNLLIVHGYGLSRDWFWGCLGLIVCTNLICVDDNVICWFWCWDWIWIRLGFGNSVVNLWYVWDFAGFWYWIFGSFVRRRLFFLVVLQVVFIGPGLGLEFVRKKQTLCTELGIGTKVCSWVRVCVLDLDDLSDMDWLWTYFKKQYI